MLMSSIDKFFRVSYSNLYVCREVDELRAELRKYCHQTVRGSVSVAYKLLKNCFFFFFPWWFMPFASFAGCRFLSQVSRGTQANRYMFSGKKIDYSRVL